MTIVEAERALGYSSPLAGRLSRARAIGAEIIHNPTAIAGLLILGVIVLMVLAAPLIGRYPPNAINVNALSQTPSAAHWFGTDQLGRDLWARVLFGGRVSLPAGVVAVAISLLIGTPIGVFAGFVGGYVDDLIMRAMDVLLAFPGILLAIGVIAILGVGLKPAVIGLGIGGIPLYARVSRASTLSVREFDFVAAARTQGVGTVRMLRKHIMPNVIDPLIVLATLNTGGAILAISALSFLGLGTQLPNADWGTMLSSGYQNMFTNWAGVAFPGIAIMLTVLGINLLGDGIGDALDPRR